MPRRHRHRIGDYLMKDDYTGIVRYASQLDEDWNGMFTIDTDGEHPQWYVYALDDPKALTHIRPEQTIVAYVCSRPISPGQQQELLLEGGDSILLLESGEPLIQETSNPRPLGPATHLFPVSGG